MRASHLGFTSSRAPRPIELLSTLGPASLDARVIERLTDAGVTLFRINLSHTRAEDLRELVSFVRGHTHVPICLDSEGAQIRTATLHEGSVKLQAGARVQLGPKPGEGAIPLHPKGIACSFRTGDLVSLDFNGVLLQVLEVTAKGARARVLRGGEVGSNKAVSLQRTIALPALTEKDRRSIAIGRALGVRHFALSFAARSRDVETVRKLAGPRAFVISKIESRRALRNLEAIAKASDALLIDRGDLSREVEIEQIPRIQRAVIARGRALGVRTYVATNLLESMLEAPTPTRAEVNDVYTTLRDGADGLVLAAETAIGRHPIQCANLVMKIAAGDPTAPPSLDAHEPEQTSLLVRPHGGALVRPSKPCVEQAANLDVEVSADCFATAQQIASGFLSPVRGFMEQRELDSVVERGCLPDATPWRVPVLLPASELGALAKGIGPGARLTLRTAGEHARLGLRVEAVFESQATGGRRNGFIAGEVTACGEDPARSSLLELTPTEARYTFDANGWTRVVGLPVTDARESDVAQRVDALLAQTGADGVYVALCGTLAQHRDRALATQDRLIEALRGWEAAVVIGALVPLELGAGDECFWIDAVRFKNLGCSHLSIEGRNPRRAADILAPLGLRPVVAHPRELLCEPQPLPRVSPSNLSPRLS
ncbi:MAG: sulfate adenylyltransferase [bacterium]|nr:sulfate adenylyltransferase [bacterium]